VWPRPDERSGPVGPEVPRSDAVLGPPPVTEGRAVAGAIPVGRPLTVYTLIVLNTAVYLWTAIQAHSVQYNDYAPLFQAWELIAGQPGQWWRLVTSGFLHFGPLHLAVNMWSLWVIGKDFERVLGRPRFIGVYAVSLLSGSAAAFWLSAAGSAVAGASGAIFGIMGGLTVLLRRLRLSLRPALIMIVINLVFSVTVPGISLAAHVGGLLTGAALTAILLYGPSGRSRANGS
jgi:membrane associated rhomboid family serine protease